LRAMVRVLLSERFWNLGGVFEKASTFLTCVPS
jgi:hypothetical protein